MWPAIASARGARAPKPLDAPVTTISLSKTISIFLLLALSKGRTDLISDAKSDYASVGTKQLAIDPGAVGTGEKRDGGGDVLRRTQALQRVHLRHAVDELLRLAVQEQVGRGRAWRDSIDGN